MPVEIKDVIIEKQEAVGRLLSVYADPTKLCQLLGIEYQAIPEGLGTLEEFRAALLDPRNTRPSLVTYGQRVREPMYQAINNYGAVVAVMSNSHNPELIRLDVGSRTHLASQLVFIHEETDEPAFADQRVNIYGLSFPPYALRDGVDQLEIIREGIILQVDEEGEGLIPYARVSTFKPPLLDSLQFVAGNRVWTASLKQYNRLGGPFSRENLKA